MKANTTIQLFRTGSLCLLFAAGVLLAGCDSGGSDGGGGSKSGAVTAEVAGGDATGSLSVEFTYPTSDGTCNTFAFDENFDAPGDKEFDPTVISTANCQPDEPKQWQEVEVTFNPDGSADGLTLTVTSGGSEIGSTSSPNDTGNLEVSVSGDDS